MLVELLAVPGPDDGCEVIQRFESTAHKFADHKFLREANGLSVDRLYHTVEVINAVIEVQLGSRPYLVEAFLDTKLEVSAVVFVAKSLVLILGRAGLRQHQKLFQAALGDLLEIGELDVNTIDVLQRLPGILPPNLLDPLFPMALFLEHGIEAQMSQGLAFQLLVPRLALEERT